MVEKKGSRERERDDRQILDKDEVEEGRLLHISSK
jgi:hypothetical protein